MTPAQLDKMRGLWEGSPELTAKDIGERFGLSSNSIIGHADRRGWGARRGGTKPSPPVSQAIEPAAIPKLSPRLCRRDREPRGYVPTTLFDRVGALHHSMDDVLRETGVRR